MHIHPSSPNSSISEEDAATRIQASFRGYKVRKALRRSTNGHLTAAGNANQNQRRHEYNGNSNGHAMDTSNSDYDEDKFATKIQSCFRGYRERQRFQKQKVARNAACIKIQASVRGFLTRKELRKQLKSLKE